SDFGIRNCFVPREGYFLLAVDYKAFEFRAMLDTAGEEGLAKQIEDGLDPHQATADLVGISRRQAKTINFGLLFGMGAQKLADALGVDIYEGKRIKYQYFRSEERRVGKECRSRWWRYNEKRITR